MTTDPLADRLTLGIDVGGSHAKIVAVQADGTVVAETRIDSGAGATPGTLVPALVAAVDTAFASAGLSRSDLVAAGLAVPGFVDDHLVASTYSPNTPGLVGAEFPRLLASALGLPMTFDSDVNAAAYGEATWGSGRGATRFLTLTVGTGLGGGLVVDGRLVRFAGGTIGDVGHVIIEPGGRRCSAGCAGCAEGLVGTAGVVDIARAAGAPPDVDRPALVIAGVAAGEVWALRAAERVGRIMGILVASLMPILLADRVAIVGGTATMGAPLFASIRTTVAAVGGPDYVHDRAIVEGRFAANAGAVGAAALALHERRTQLDR